ncbi:MAG TPA: SGNH/GDSL hydrolase family protein [Armatimonadota bacterium]|nr:SGNH/GDSL hydrolase family protein [Armatimonadota bacterium]
MNSPSLSRRQLLAGAAAGITVSAAGRAFADSPEAAAKTEGGTAWYDVQQWGVEGRGWTDTARYFDRLPARAKESVRPEVWELSRHSAGMRVRFRTDATAIRVRYALLRPNLAMVHMPATGVSGLDLYAQDAAGRDRWLAVGFPTQQRMDFELVSGLDPAPDGRLYTLYLPLYNGVESLEIGVDAKAMLRPSAPPAGKPVVLYGTSIMQGACASRPGIAMTAILGRRLQRTMINLGFSGNGRMEREVGALLAELDPSVYVIDCLPNMKAEEVAQRAGPLVRQLRQARPETPILLVEDRTRASAPFVKELRDHHRACRAELRKAYQQLRAEGVPGLHYLRGEPLLGEDDEATTDGSHPNDLGMVRYADAYERVLRPLLERKRRG